ncbi:type II toxin-antitoxin system HigB family toxin [Rhizobium sullae]|uniref:type II toxin-antitoxin system HigB family toxin n=1 Tax=Rhizobium sullae TaxID=50338 RepID=UPI000B35294C|nr:type II toxin-antitoxin system HigB family toxin [Rhizobium sullae]
MQIIAKSTLRAFWERHPQAKVPLSVWHSIVSKANWTGPSDIKKTFGTNVDFVGDNRVIFDIGGNKYRLIVHVAYGYGRVLIKFIGTHAEYDRIDPETV